MVEVGLGWMAAACGSELGTDPDTINADYRTFTGTYKMDILCFRDNEQDGSDSSPTPTPTSPTPVLDASIYRYATQSQLDNDAFHLLQEMGIAKDEAEDDHHQDRDTDEDDMLSVSSRAESFIGGILEDQPWPSTETDSQDDFVLEEEDEEEDEDEDELPYWSPLPSPQPPRVFDSRHQRTICCSPTTVAHKDAEEQEQDFELEMVISPLILSPFPTPSRSPSRPPRARSRSPTLAEMDAFFGYVPAMTTLSRVPAKPSTPASPPLPPFNPSPPETRLLSCSNTSHTSTGPPKKRRRKTMIVPPTPTPTPPPTIQSPGDDPEEPTQEQMDAFFGYVDLSSPSISKDSGKGIRKSSNDNAPVQKLPTISTEVFYQLQAIPKKSAETGQSLSPEDKRRGFSLSKYPCC